MEAVTCRPWPAALSANACSRYAFEYPRPPREGSASCIIVAREWGAASVVCQRGGRGRETERREDRSGEPPGVSAEGDEGGEGDEKSARVYRGVGLARGVACGPFLAPKNLCNPRASSRGFYMGICMVTPILHPFYTILTIPH